MPSRSPVERLSWAIVLVSSLHAAGAAAQSVCAGPPYLGTTGLEICIEITDHGSGASMDFRGVSPQSIVATVGDYTVDLDVILAAGPAGLGLTIEGTATRTSAGTGALAVVADGGTVAPLPAASGDLELVGSATGTSQIQLGGAAGYPAGATGDLAYRGFPRIIDVPVFGPIPVGSPAGDFAEALPGQPVDAGAVAVHNITTFHINEVGVEVEIPSSVAIGSPPPPDGNGNGEEEEEGNGDGGNGGDGDGGNGCALVASLLLLPAALVWTGYRRRSRG